MIQGAKRDTHTVDRAYVMRAKKDTMPRRAAATDASTNVFRMTLLPAVTWTMVRETASRTKLSYPALSTARRMEVSARGAPMLGARLPSLG